MLDIEAESAFALLLAISEHPAPVNTVVAGVQDHDCERHEDDGDQIECAFSRVLLSPHHKYGEQCHEVEGLYRHSSGHADGLGQRWYGICGRTGWSSPGGRAAFRGLSRNR